MILVIPLIEIKSGKCARKILSETGLEYPDDPVEVARIWRRENAKVLHIIDADGLNERKPVNIDIIEKIISSIDIPIQVEAGASTYDDVKILLDAGALRVVIEEDIALESDLLKKLIANFTPKKIIVKVEGNKEAINSAMQMKMCGIERVIYKCMNDGERDFDEVKKFAIETGLKVTLYNCVSGYDDLKALSEFENFGIDSVIIGRALYENRFPCQKLWRKIETEAGF